MPFSYLIENATESYLVPAVNLRSVGTIRDAQKWPKRDNRKDPHKLDQINYNLLSPYTIQKMWRGREILQEIQQLSGETTEVYAYQNCKIRHSSLNNGIKLYTTGILKFLGNSLISRLSQQQWSNLAELRKALQPDNQIGLGEWIDCSGLIAPKSEIIRLLDDIQSAKINSLYDVQNRFVEMHQNYYSYEWTWALDKLQIIWGKPAEEVTLDDIIKSVEDWKTAVVDLDKMVYDDAKKEFNLNAHTGFGVDGDDEQNWLDFENVRGRFESNSFVLAVIEHINKKTALGESMLSQLRQLTH